LESIRTSDPQPLSIEIQTDVSSEPVEQSSTKDEEDAKSNKDDNENKIVKEDNIEIPSDDDAKSKMPVESSPLSNDGNESKIVKEDKQSSKKERKQFLPRIMSDPQQPQLPTETVTKNNTKSVEEISPESNQEKNTKSETTTPTTTPTTVKREGTSKRQKFLPRIMSEPITPSVIQSDDVKSTIPENSPLSNKDENESKTVKEDKQPSEIQSDEKAAKKERKSRFLPRIMSDPGQPTIESQSEQPIQSNEDTKTKMSVEEKPHKAKKSKSVKVGKHLTEIQSDEKAAKREKKKKTIFSKPRRKTNPLQSSIETDEDAKIKKSVEDESNTPQTEKLSFSDGPTLSSKNPDFPKPALSSPDIRESTNEPNRDNLHKQKSSGEVKN